MSLRRKLYRRYRFTEAFGGYSLAEDTELSFRIGATEALFFAPELAVLHRKAATGRPDPYRRGRMYVANMLAIAPRQRAGWGGHLAAAGLSPDRDDRAGVGVVAAELAPAQPPLAGGMAAELGTRLARAAGRLLCGC